MYVHTYIHTYIHTYGCVEVDIYDHKPPELTEDVQFRSSSVSKPFASSNSTGRVLKMFYKN